MTKTIERYLNVMHYMAPGHFAFDFAYMTLIRLLESDGFKVTETDGAHKIEDATRVSNG